MGGYFGGHLAAAGEDRCGLHRARASPRLRSRA
ncbi:MAG: hypothetical protein ACRDKT_14385 [Actinomycetota bacterium]